jgi:hypothetical protein
MAEQLFLPGLERNPALDFLFFAFVLRGEDAPRIVQLRERLCRKLGLTGQLIAPRVGSAFTPHMTCCAAIVW